MVTRSLRTVHVRLQHGCPECSPRPCKISFDSFRYLIFTTTWPVKSGGTVGARVEGHTAAAIMINDGADPRRVKRQMGHEEIHTTSDISWTPVPRPRPGSRGTRSTAGSGAPALNMLTL
jgi:hypothetical protein